MIWRRRQRRVRVHRACLGSWHLLVYEAPWLGVVRWVARSGASRLQGQGGTVREAQVLAERAVRRQARSGDSDGCGAGGCLPGLRPAVEGQGVHV